MYKYEVGKLYHPSRTSWPEGIEYNWRQNTHELKLFYRYPSAEEIAAVKRAPAECALTVVGDILFLVFRFGAQPWSDAPYSWWMVPPDQRTPPPALAGEERALLNVLLIDAGTGIIRAVRAISLGPAFSQALHAAIRAQAAAASFDQAAYDRQLAAAYRLYRNSGALLAAATARTRGGM